MFKTRKRTALSITVISLVALALAALFIYLFRTTPNGNLYISKDSDMKPEKVVKLLRDAEAKNDTFPDIQFTYDFHVDCEIDNATYRFGTVNVIAFTGRGTPDAKGHRTNTYTSIKEGTTQDSRSESFYFNNGKTYAMRFGKYYWSEMAEENFLPYTNYSSISANTDFLSEIFFNKAVVYERFKGITEICFTDEAVYLDNGIITFIGLDKTDYEYEVTDVLLTVIIAKNGTIAEKHLTFNVEYYSKSEPDNVLTYEGDFAYTLDKTSDITTNEQNKSDSYQQISNIQLLSSLTESGYLILSNQPGFDVTYKKQITVTDSSGEEYSYDGALNVVAVKNGDKLSYSSIDTEKHFIDEEFHNTVGIFVNDSGYTERAYDYIKGEITSAVDNRENDYTSNELISIIMEAIAAERLFEDDISSVSTISEDGHTVTYSVRLVGVANKNFAGYLVDFFTKDGESFLDVTSLAFNSTRCDVQITVRKSDGCIMQQIIDYAATLYGTSGMSGAITVEGRCEMTVNATGDDLALLDVDDFAAEVEKNKAE